MAPERLLVFEVTGSIQDFAKAAARIPGLEFAGEEELERDDLDESPELYLLVPQLAALREIVSLWETWQATGTLPRGFTPWRNLFQQLRSVRPWGPQDRVTPANREYFAELVADAPDARLVRVEIELIFRQGADASQLAASETSALVDSIGGNVVQAARHPEFAYHALLVDLPAHEVRRIVELDPDSLAGADPIAAIVPQSVGTPVDAEDAVAAGVAPAAPTNPEPVVAIFDAVPVQAHPLLSAHLLVDDPADLEAKAVGPRVHGTAMASLVVHGDLNDPPTPIRRRVYFRPLMYASGEVGQEIFDDDKLLIDVVVSAVANMRAGSGERVIVVNLSLGDRTKPFAGRISTWGRALDFLAYRYGILFLVSTGNISEPLALTDFASTHAFEAAALSARSTATLKAIDATKAERRLLAPADSVNALSVGAWHRDSSTEVFGGTTPFPPYDGQEMPNVSSRLGPGLKRATKPDVLFSGGRQRVRLDLVAAPASLIPHPHPTRFWGLKVAAPPQGPQTDTHFTLGTSAATAVASHCAHRIWDALELAYPQLLDPMPPQERAALLKALLVHSASWRGTDSFVRSVVDPTANLHHEHWRREVSRHLGYGFVDTESAVACAEDRATLWATGSLQPEQAIAFDLPVPTALTASPGAREIRATLAWFTPIRPGHLAYRAVKLKIASLQPEELDAAGVATLSGQPPNSQSESGTIVHRRWTAAKIGDGTASTIPIQIQRERDQGTPIDEAVPFGLAVTIEMPGQPIYEEVRASVGIQPQVLA